MDEPNRDIGSIGLPEDQLEAMRGFAAKYGETVRDLVIAAIDHFVRIPEEQRKAVIRGTARRRK